MIESAYTPKWWLDSARLNDTHLFLEGLDNIIKVQDMGETIGVFNYAENGFSSSAVTPAIWIAACQLPEAPMLAHILKEGGIGALKTAVAALRET